MTRRMLVLGLDSLPPRVLYEGMDGGGFEYIRGLVGDAARYVMRTCHPPITVPAWISMFTGRTPGELGIYGFRHRRPGEFGYYIVNSRFIREPALWDEAGRRGLRAGIFGVPPTYPPRPLRGFMVTDFTTPGPHRPYTFPPDLRRFIEERYGPPIFDIVYRSTDKARVARELVEMVKNHMRIVGGLATSRRWDLLVYVEIGVDRAHHAFWRYFDPRHPRYEEHPVYSGVIPRVYRMIDEWLEDLLGRLPRDTITVIVSDHGVKPMKGAFAVNQWLEEQGYLVLKKRPEKPGEDLREDMVDWERTKAWAWGGYYSRIFVNLKGREKRGSVEPGEYEVLIEQLRRDLEHIGGPGGEHWRNRAYRPGELYPVVRGDAPDMMLYLDDLDWRPAGTVGWPTPYLEENDRGPDDAVHDWDGVLAIHDPEGTISPGDHGAINIHGVRDLLGRLLWGGERRHGQSLRGRGEGS